MTIYNLYIFDRHCQLIFYQDWHRRNRSLANTDSPGSSAAAAAGSAGGPGGGAGGNPPTAGTTTAAGGDASGAGVATESTDMSLEEEAKLVYGVVFSLKNLVNKLSAKTSEGFLAYRTSSYKLHYYETPTGLKFVLNTDPSIETDPMRQVLKQIYTQIYVEYVIKNPLVKVDRQIISNEYFKNELNRYVSSLPIL